MHSEKIIDKIDKEKDKSLRKIKNEKLSKTLTTLQLKSETDIAMDFAFKVYQKIGKSIKSIILFGSAAKKTMTIGSDIDIVIVIDDVSVKWDQELIAWYREELNRILKLNPYPKELHINTIKLSTWWEDLMKGDPVIINILRYGEAMIDLAGFFEPLKFLLIQGKIRPTPEAIYTSLQRAPLHLQQSKLAELNAVEGLYWTMVDSAHAALIAQNVSPPSPEHIPADLKEQFVDTGKLEMKYVSWFRELLVLHKKIEHREIRDLKGVELDIWQDRTQEFLDKMTQLVKDLIENK